MWLLLPLLRRLVLHMLPSGCDFGLSSVAGLFGDALQMVLELAL